MSNALKTVGAVKAAAAIAILSTTTVFAAQVVLPDAAGPTGVSSSSDGLGIANDAIDQAAPAAEGADPQGAAADVETQLADNQGRLLDALNTVADRLADQDADQHAIDALGNVIDRIENGDTGLNRATEAVTSAPAVSAPVAHPTATQRPSRP